MEVVLCDVDYFHGQNILVMHYTIKNYTKSIDIPGIDSHGPRRGVALVNEENDKTMRLFINSFLIIVD